VHILEAQRDEEVAMLEQRVRNAAPRHREEIDEHWAVEAWLWRETEALKARIAELEGPPARHIDAANHARRQQADDYALKVASIIEGLVAEHGPLSLEETARRLSQIIPTPGGGKVWRRTQVVRVLLISNRIRSNS
jgi:hypothetical protein